MLVRCLKFLRQNVNTNTWGQPSQAVELWDSSIVACALLLLYSLSKLKTIPGSDFIARAHPTTHFLIPQVKIFLVIFYFLPFPISFFIPMWVAWHGEAWQGDPLTKPQTQTSHWPYLVTLAFWMRLPNCDHVSFPLRATARRTNVYITKYIVKFKKNHLSPAHFHKNIITY